MADELKDGMSFAHSKDFPIIETVQRVLMLAVETLVHGPLSRTSARVRDELLGSVLLKIAVTALTQGSTDRDVQRVHDMVDVYAKVVAEEIAMAEKQGATTQ